jgi:hypothetical protein
MGRWSAFTNLALSTIFAIAGFEDPLTGKNDLLLGLQPDEALFLRLDILKHFRMERLLQPSKLRGSPLAVGPT